MKRSLVLAITIFLLSLLASGQATPTTAGQQSLAERLGYSRDAKLLIVHADDLGMAHSVNAASIKAFETGLVNSGSIMVPCPWLQEIASYARSHQDADLGLHLTLTSEWSLFRWGPVLSKDRVPSLFNRDGYLYPTEDQAASRIDAREAETELRAQIERARSFGIQPTHLDSHMGTLYQNEALFRAFVKVSRENKLPIRIARDRVSETPFIASSLGPDDIVIDRILEIDPTVKPEAWATFYTDAIKSIRPGVTEVVVHLAYDDEEMRAATINHPDWGAGWRQRDFEFFTNDAFRRLLKENDIKLITWRELGKLMKGTPK